MNGSLHERVLTFVAANPGLTSTQIARGVAARTQDVVDALADEAFSASERAAYPADRAQVYQLASEAGERLGKAVRRSQCDLIAAVLVDGRWHTTAELHRRCGFSRLNSRIAELRDPRKRWGMIIDSRRIQGVRNGSDAYEYRFVGYRPGFDRNGRIAATSEGGDGVRVPACPAPSSLPSGVPASAALSPEPAEPPAGTPELPEAA